MKPKIYLALALHNHQPVGNFDDVFAKAYQKAYLPMLEALERHPGVRLAVHNTGCLLDWLVANRPEYIERLSALVARNQIEIMTGGYYEPILVSLPDRDKIGQVHKLTTAVQDHFRTEPTGAWLAERIWEPHLPRPLHEAGVKYTIVDDTHFRYAGLKDEEMFGYYITEEQGKTLKVFATAKHLRYVLPWEPVPKVIEWLKEMANSELKPGLYVDRPKVAVMGDDGEKFGLWPRTYKHCWEDGWVEQFFTALEENSDWLTTITPGDFATQYPALGRVYLTAASYDEMTEWALPPTQSHRLHTLKYDLQEKKENEVLEFIKGGLWRNFMVKYPEVNQMHKKALWVSQKLHMTPDFPGKEAIINHLWSAQCNCGYWHGLFGGIYLFHIRGINYRNLITAEISAESHLAENGPLVVHHTDFDLDGNDELILGNEHQWLMFDPQKGGMITEWDYRPTVTNILNAIGRHFEGYHPELISAAENDQVELYQDEEGEVENVHGNKVRVRELGLEKRLFYDWYRRGALVDHFLAPDATLDQVAGQEPALWQIGLYERRQRSGEVGNFVERPYQVTTAQNDETITTTLSRTGQVLEIPVTLVKQITLHRDSHDLQVGYTITNKGETTLRCLFAVENTWGLEGGQDPLTYLSGLGDERQGMTTRITVEGINEFTLVSEISTVRTQIGYHLSQPATIWAYPLESVTNSESGYERNYQGTAVMTVWELDLAPSQIWQVNLEFQLSKVEE